MQVTHTYPPYVGGLSNVTENLSKKLAKMGHEVTVITLDVDGNLPRKEEIDGVKIKRFKGYAPFQAYFCPSPSAIEYLRRVKADVIHVHNIGALLVPATWWAIKDRLQNLTYVVSPHHHRAGSKWHTKLLWKPYKPIASKTIKAAHAVHAVSNHESKLIQKDFGVKPVMIPNGIAEGVLKCVWRRPSSETVITYAGRLEKYKRVHKMLEAVAMIKSVKSEITVRVIGQGPAEKQLLNLAKSLDVKIEHHKFLPRNEYLKLLSESTCFVNISKYEAFSIVTAEALSIGMPAVVAKPWGFHFVDAGSVELVDGESAGEIAIAVEKAIKNSSSSQQRSVNAFLSWDEVAKQIVTKIYGR